MGGVGDEATDGDCFFGKNLINIDAGTERTTILLLFFDDLSVRPFVEGVGGSVIVIVDIDQTVHRRIVVSFDEQDGGLVY